MRTRIASIAVALLAVACTKEPAASKPVAVTLKIDTNQVPTTNLDAFRLTVHQKGHDPDSRPYPLPDTRLPAFRPIIPGEEKRPHVTITLEGILKGRPVGKLEAQFDIPENYYEELLLKVPVAPEAGLKALGLRTQAVDGLGPPTGGFRLDLLMDGLCSADVFTTECAEGETCIAGACRTSTVDITTLPVFGHDGKGSSTSPSECTKVGACFANRRAMDVASDCKMVSPAPHGMTNVAVALDRQAGIGTCDDIECLLPLDYGAPPHGWTRAAEMDGGAPLGTDGTIQLDEELCKTALSNGLRGFQRFVVSGDCPTFEQSVAPCPPEASTEPDDRSDGGPDGGPDDGGGDGGEASTDFVVTGVLPADAATGVEPDAIIRLGFSMPLHADNAVGGVLDVSDGTTSIKGTVEVEGNDLVFRPSQPMALRNSYRVTAAKVRAANGTLLGPDHDSKFTTRDGRWLDATSVSDSPASRPQLVIGPDGHTLVVFEVDGQLQSVRRTVITPAWTRINFPTNGFNVEGKFLLRSDPVWGALTVARDSVLSAMASSRYQWTDKDWEPVEAIESSGFPDPFDALVQGGQGWVIYQESSGPRLGSHGAKGNVFTVFPAAMTAAGLPSDAPGQVTVVYAAEAAGAGSVVREQVVPSKNEPGPAVEIARFGPGAPIESLRAYGDGAGVINAFWIQQLPAGEGSQVMASRRESGVWSTPREVYATTGAFLMQLSVAGNSREEAALAWIDDNLTDGPHLFATSTARSSTASARELLAENAKAPKAAIDPIGNGAVVWLNVSAVRTVRAARLNDGSWSDSEDIPGSSGADVDTEPDVAFDVDGRGWAAWTSASGVQVSRFE